jgi:signal transduction histidine kinase
MLAVPRMPQACPTSSTCRRSKPDAWSWNERLGAIRGDERKVKQVLLNLLSNALKFTPEGGRIDVRAAVADGMAEISVTDTGLGLPLARKFVELHGGRLWLKSQVGVGSMFTFALPLATS